MRNIYADKNILVIGGTGTIGQALIKELVNFKPKAIRVFSRDEYKQFVMAEELKEYSNIRYLIGDIRDKERIIKAMQNIDIVFDFAALKHVPACEYNPFEAVKTNVMGTQNVIDAAIENNVEKVIYSSSDKAVSPTNTMGATKLLAEKIISAANYSKGNVRTVFAAVRFGNIMGSRGSVIPLFKEQIMNNRCVTVTDPEMTRFMMTLKEAVSLMFRVAEKALGGEIFISKMPVVKIGDLANAVIDEVCARRGIDRNEVKTEVIGLRPGEKMYEELMTGEEAANAIEMQHMYAILPFNEKILRVADEYENSRVLSDNKEYISKYKECMNIEEIRRILRDEKLVFDYVRKGESW